MLAEWMKELQGELELNGSLASEKPDIYALPIESNLKILISPYLKGFKLYCEICQCPKNDRESFACHTLLGNLFAQGTNGATLGISNDGNVLTLSKAVDNSAGFKDFRDSIEDFINIVDFWKEEVQNMYQKR